MPFVPALFPETEQKSTDLWFVFRGEGLLVKETGAGCGIPRGEDVRGLAHDFQGAHYLGTLDGTPCFAADTAGRMEAPGGMSFQDLRPLLTLLEEELFSTAGRAFQIVHWDRTHRFCGRCGSPTQPKTGERAKTCPQCGLDAYPQVTPAIIVAVTRGREILLAHSPRYRYVFYSILAGFVEPGETFEETVMREVKEEVGIEVRDIRYFGSQPWPFPNSLMVGFTAEYAGGELKIDNTEISDARWFTPEDLPETPRTGTIARRLIDWFVARNA
ncbi:MAG TPA: NAD(+) diphosphatase [Dissulfurispiraceae bacterium]